MRLSVSKSPNATSLYVIKSVTVDGKRTTKVIEKLGTLEELEKKLQGTDPFEWAKEYISALNRKEEEGKTEIIARFSNTKQIPTGQQVRYNAGYPFLQDIYYELKLDKICKRDHLVHPFRIRQCISISFGGRLILN